MPMIEFMGQLVQLPDSLSAQEIEDRLNDAKNLAGAFLEPAALIASSAVAEPVSGFTAIATGDTGAIQPMQESMTYQPRTEAGRNATRRLAESFQALAEEMGLENAAGYWRERVVPALQEEAGVVGGAVLGAGALGLMAVMSDVVPGSKSATRGSKALQRGSIDVTQKQPMFNMTSVGDTKRDFAMLSAERFDLSPEENAIRTQALQQDLVGTFGPDRVTPVKGRYGGADERSFLVDDTTLDERQALLDLGNKYDQESVIHPGGLEYLQNSDTPGMVRPLRSRTPVDATDADDNFTEMPVTLGNFEQGTKKFTFDIDFSTDDILYQSPLEARLSPGELMTEIGTHYSPVRNLEVLDPGQAGTRQGGRRGAEFDREQTLPKTYLYTGDAPRREPSLSTATNQYSDIPLAGLYNIDDDPLNIRAYARNLNQREELMRRSGASGYWTAKMADDRAGRTGTVAMFDPVPVDGGLDLTDLENRWIDRPQVPLERYTPPRGKPATLKGVMGPKNTERVEGIAAQGVERGGHNWYNTEPLYRRFVQEYGPEEGQARFDRYMDIVAATSPRSTVDANIKRASLLYQRDMEGQPISTLENPDLPKGYGHIAHKTHNALLKDLEGGEHFQALNRPKTSSFAENLKGNLRPMTLDTHNRAAVFPKGAQGAKKSPSNTEYVYLEEWQQRMGQDLGIEPAQVQSAIWVGGDELTGVSDSRPFIAVFDDAVTRTAGKTGKSKDEVLRDFITGKAPLMSLLAAAGMLGADNEPERGVQ